MNKIIIVSFLFIAVIASKGLSQSQTMVEKIDKENLTRLIHERQGKILFLNLWATWCMPCREEFPDIVKLVNEFRDKNIEFIGISIDYPDEINSKIIPFLKKNKSNFKNYVNGIKGDEALINLLNEKWNGALPATFIYNTGGKQITFLEGKHSLEEFKKALE